MSSSSEHPLLGGPYAPRIPYTEYVSEKREFAGILMGAAVYGIVIIMFFQCLIALLGPTNRTGRIIKWGLVAHVVAMFTFQTVSIVIQLRLQSISYIDFREFPASDGSLYSGPFAYQYSTSYSGINAVPLVMFFLNNWLADGLLLYRLSIIYVMNYWVIAFPCLMYLASLTIGILFVYEVSRVANFLNPPSLPDFGTPFYSISLSINILLTLMIVIRLVLHDRSFRKATGTRVTAGGLYKAVVTMLIESCALHAISFLLYMAPWSAGSSVTNIFYTTFTGIQVVAPFLVILRVANMTALTCDSTVIRSFGTIDFCSQGISTSGNETLRELNPASPMDAPGEPGGRFEAAIDCG